MNSVGKVPQGYENSMLEYLHRMLPCPTILLGSCSLGDGSHLR